MLRLVTILSLMTFMACKSKKQALTDTATAYPYVLKYERGPCYGQCPVYTFYVLSDHNGLVESKANLMDTAGWYTTSLDQEAVAEILELIEPESWWTPELGDQPEIPDLPASKLSYWHQKGLRTISIHSRTNHELEKVFSKLGHLVSNSSWSRTDTRPIETTPVPMTDVIVHLKAGVDIDEWMQKFDRFGISLKRKLTPNQSFYLVTKDVGKGDANDFLQYIKRDPDVIDAQWDHQVKERD